MGKGMDLINIPQIKVLKAHVQEILEHELKLETNEYLMNRARLGIPLKKAVVKRFPKDSSEYVLVVDLEGIKEVSGSVAEELGPHLFIEFLKFRENHSEFYLAYCNIEPEVVKAIDGAFLQWKKSHQHVDNFSVLATKNTLGDIFGDHLFLGEKIPDSLQDILNILYRKGEITSNSLDELDIKAPSRKLSEITNQFPWLIRKYKQRVEGTDKAWTYLYLPIVNIGGTPNE